MSKPDRRQDQSEEQPDALAVALALGQPRRGGGREQPDEQQVERLAAPMAAMMSRQAQCPQVGALDLGVVAQDVGVVGQHDAAGLQHVAALGDVERVVGVLLDEQDRHARPC